MVEIFLIQLLAAALGALSTALADWLYHGGRIGQRWHSFWVSASIAMICVPVLAWTSSIFLGSGLLSEAVSGIFVLMMFVWVYRNLPKPRSVEKLALRLSPPPGSTGTVPPVSKLNG